MILTSQLAPNRGPIEQLVNIVLQMMTRLYAVVSIGAVSMVENSQSLRTNCDTPFDVIEDCLELENKQL
jgi:hypothetical protein